MLSELTISEKVKIELSRKKMTQIELAEKLGLNKVTISQRMTADSWKPTEISFMKHELGFNL